MLAVMLALFIAGWATQGLTLFDVGPYSLPLIMFAAIPFCLKLKLKYAWFLMLPVISTIFAVVVGLMGESALSKVVSQTFLQCLAIGFAGGVASIDWRPHLDTLAGSSVSLGIPIVGYGGYQMVARTLHLPFAFLPITNKQYWVDGGMQRDWDKAETTRASSFFSEPSEFGLFCLWLIAIGLSQKSGPLQTAALILGGLGIFFSQSLSAVLGAVVLMTVYFFSQGIGAQTIRQLVVMGIIAALGIGMMQLWVPQGFNRLSERVLQVVTLDERADSGRVDHLPAIWRTFSESPIWGHGISSLAASTNSGSDSTTINYAMLLMERGVVGTVLFLLPWFAITTKAWLLPVTRQGRSVAVMVMTMTLYAYFSFSLTYFLPFWLAFGIAASLVRGDPTIKAGVLPFAVRPSGVTQTTEFPRPPIST